MGEVMDFYSNHNSYIRLMVETALQEDVPGGDITSETCISESSVSDAAIIAKASGVVAGMDFVMETFRQCGVAYQVIVTDGGRVSPGDTVLKISSQSTRGILKAERTALNYLGHLSGIATAAAQFVTQVEGTGCVILDTRKTTPGLRAAEKAAVKAGGGQNHRFGLSDGILIKDNHVRAAGGVGLAVKMALAAGHSPGFLIEVEVTNLAELDEAIRAGAKRVLLDNMTIAQMTTAAALARSCGVQTEASGNVTLDNVRAVAETGVDFISIGWITHSAPCLDFSLEIA